MKFIITFLLLLVSINAHAELYKWVDAAGKVHYSDSLPPPDAKEQQLHVQQVPGTTTDTSSARKSTVPAGKSIYERAADMEKSMKTRQEENQKAAEEKQREEAKKLNCENARNALNSLQSSPRLATYDANGNRTMMDDAERQQRVQQARESVRNFCN